MLPTTQEEGINPSVGEFEGLTTSPSVVAVDPSLIVYPSVGGGISSVGRGCPSTEVVSKVFDYPFKSGVFSSKAKVSNGMDQRFDVSNCALNSAGSQASPREDFSPTGTIVSFISNI